MSAGQGSSTDPFFEDEDFDSEAEDAELVKQIMEMRIDELPEELQRKIFKYKIRMEADENKVLERMDDRVRLNRFYLDEKQNQMDRINYIMNNYRELTEYWRTNVPIENELNEAMEIINTFETHNNRIIRQYEQDLQLYLHMTRQRYIDRYGNK